MKEILLESTFVSIDIETTGFDEESSDIIEIACVRVEGCIITDRFSTLVNPGYLLPDRIVKLTGITNAMIVGKPNIYEVLPHFLRFVGDSIIVGHHVEKDMAFIDKAYRVLYGKKFKHPHICTLSLARNILPDLKRYSLKDLADHFNIRYRRLHRALDDAETTAYLFIELLNLLWNHLRVGDYLGIKRLSKA
ncbi:DNA polymerase III PolC-type [bacterium HR13]|uniref:DNA polymerase III subunit epsilon n=1 Tax=uncultured Aquificia bacterium TaxID=453415 RepID=H5SJM1_9BACT|nr:DNA polymerase III subunit epsilon [uncultured Aquificae bacterium]GBC88113.1 DNA polymerase III PolC-type [bacterium HR13]